MDNPPPIQIILNPSDGILELRLEDKLSSSALLSPLTSTSSSTNKRIWVTSFDIHTSTQIKSMNDSYIAFKVKVTAHQRYSVKPSTGWIKCGETITIRIATIENITANDISNDKFLVEVSSCSHFGYIYTEECDNIGTNPKNSEWIIFYVLLSVSYL